MPLYWKRVQAEQFSLSQDDRDLILKNIPVYFHNEPVKHNEGRYHANLPHRESLLTIREDQWLVKHDNGIWEILNPDTFEAKFMPEGTKTKQIA